MRYDLCQSDGAVVRWVTAAEVMRWHIRQLRRDGERLFFAPRPGDVESRDSRQAWLRTMFLAALPADELRARRLVALVSPHSFRSGLAGDLYREGASFSRIGSICRWNSVPAIRLYAERPCLYRSRMTDAFRLYAAVLVPPPSPGHHLAA